MRKICYVSGTRADYGLMRTVLLKLKTDPDVDLSIVITGMHLSPLYGHTVNEIIADGLNICAQIPVDVENALPSTMAKSIGYELIGMVEVFSKEKPDIILLLGDRGEMLAGALAAAHLNIPIVHLHGGERSGTVDEMIRHAISKLAHYHFVATEGARQRLIRMGEQPDMIHLVGAPGLDEITKHEPCDRDSFCKAYHFDPHRPIALVVYHPVVQEYDHIKQQVENVLTSILDLKLQTIFLEPNADAGGQSIRDVLNHYQTHSDIRIINHLPRNKYLDGLANVDVMLGNSSSGIIEAASFNLGVVNVGSRQNFRERSNNVLDVSSSPESITNGLQTMLAKKGERYHNIYGDGKTGTRCCHLLKTVSLNSDILNKYNAY